MPTLPLLKNNEIHVGAMIKAEDGSIWHVVNRLGEDLTLIQITYVKICDVEYVPWYSDKAIAWKLK